MKHEISHLTKSIRKTSAGKVLKDRSGTFTEDQKRKTAEPYKKQKVNFKAFIDQHLDEDEDLFDTDGSYFGE